MAKLWQKGYRLVKAVEDYTVGKDLFLDEKLVEADILGNIAQARMLGRIGIVTKSESRRLCRALIRLLSLYEKGKFRLRSGDEDVHTAVENHLTRKLGALGKKIHTGRSRNDQVILDLRLYAREELLRTERSLLALTEKLLSFARKHEKVPMVGYTHSRRAMPSSVGLWAGAQAESLLDDCLSLETAYKLNDQCPLGAAASYGVSLPLDREYVARVLGFRKVQNNVLYVNNSRGKIEAVILFALSQIMADLSKMSEDLILFTRAEFQFFSLPEDICPGSSIMPQKRNPAVLEVMRARAELVKSYLFAVQGILKGLPSGYNRDLQLTKGPLLEGFGHCRESLEVAALVISRLKVNREKLRSSFSPEVFAADEALELAAGGVPFRDAYREVAGRLAQLGAKDPLKNILSKKASGAPGNLRLGVSQAAIRRKRSQVAKEERRLQAARKRLLRLP